MGREVFVSINGIINEKCQYNFNGGLSISFRLSIS